MTVAICYVCVSTLLQTKDDFRFIIPYMEFSKEVKGSRPLVLDTSVIIDGRIADVAEAQVLDQPLVVPQFVLQELQGIADSSDKLRRNRGRRGLDILNRLQKSPGGRDPDLRQRAARAGRRSARSTSGSWSWPSTSAARSSPTTTT